MSTELVIEVKEIESGKTMPLYVFGCVRDKIDLPIDDNEHDLTKDVISEQLVNFSAKIKELKAQQELLKYANEGAEALWEIWSECENEITHYEFLLKMFSVFLDIESDNKYLIPANKLVYYWSY